MGNYIVTGGNRGIGYYLTEGLLEGGHAVAVLDRELDGLAPLAARFPGRLWPLLCDVSREEEVARSVDEAARLLGGLDGAVHNACLCTFALAGETGEETYRAVLAVNYFGALHLAKSALPHLERTGGALYFTSSGVGVTGFGGIAPYASSKGAIEALAKCLRIELAGRGVGVHLLHPPLTDTRSAAPLPVPKAFFAAPEAVGKGLARRLGKRSFVICHSPAQQFQVRLCYLFPLKMGAMMDRMLRRAAEQGE